MCVLEWIVVLTLVMEVGGDGGGGCRGGEVGRCLLVITNE